MPTKKQTKLSDKEVALINGEFTSYMIDEKSGKRLSITEAVRKITKVLVTIHDKAKISLAEMLYQIYTKEYFKTWGFDNFQNYTESELDFQYRQAKYLIDIWDILVEKRKIPVEVLRKHSWTKLREIVGKAAKYDEVSLEDVKTLIEDSDKMTVEEVIYKAREVAYKSSASEKVAEPTHRVTFTLFEEQYKNVKKAIDAAEEITGSSKPGSSLDLICTEFIAGHIHGDKKKELQRIAKELEGATGCKLLVALDGEVIHANKEFDK